MSKSKVDKFGQELVSCGICGDDTPMTGTRRCNRCYELESRIKWAPELARKILSRLDKFDKGK